MEKEDLLALAHVSKTYKDATTKALDNATFSLKKGEFVSVIGSSGAGKSTLLRCINRLIDPTEGTIFFDGKRVDTAQGKELRQIRCRISMVFQHYNLVLRSSAIENVLQGRLGYKNSFAGSFGLFSQEEKQRAYEALVQVGLGDFVYARADQLSGGQKQRVGIARAFVQNPLLILADEPIASLDPRSSRTVMGHLKWAAKEHNIACLTSLHQVEYALNYSDRIIGISEGRIVFDGTPSELTESKIAEIYNDDNPESASAVEHG